MSNEYEEVPLENKPRRRPNRVPQACFATILLGGAIAAIVGLIWFTFPEDIELKLHFITDEAAVCSDGSQGAFYTRENPDSDRWIIYFEPGGSVCWSEETCTGHLDHIGTLDAPETKSWDGLFSDNEHVNPLFADANLATIVYCSSDYYTGTRFNEDGDNYHYMGYVIGQAAVADIIATTDISSASQVILAGQGAGGFGALWHTEGVVEQLQQAGSTADVRVVTDTSWWMDVEPLQSFGCANPSICTLKEIVELFAWEVWLPHVPPRCEGLTWECYFGHLSIDETFPASLFIFEWAYEQAQLMSNGMLAGPVQDDWTDEEKAWVQTYISSKLDSFQNLPSGSSFFYPTCWDHEVLNKDTWFTTAIGDKLLMQALYDWTAQDVVKDDDDQGFLDECGTVDCNPTCSVNL